MSEETPTPPKLVRDLMSVGVLTCAPDTPLIELARILLEKELEAVIVLDEHGHAAGVVNRDDLVRAYGGLNVLAGSYDTLKAEDVMQDGVPQVPPDIPLTAAAQIMLDQGVRTLFMMHHAAGIEYPAAFLTFKHLIRHMAMDNEEDISDLGIEADRELPLEAFIRRRNDSRRRVKSG